MLVGAVLAVLAWRFERSVVHDAETVEVRIPAGSGARQVARLVHGAGVDVVQWEFLAASILDGTTRHLRAGRYQFHRGQRLAEVLGQIRRGEVLPETWTVVEGMSLHEIRARLDASGDVRHDTAGWSDARIAQALGVDAPSAEGWLAPDTYLFDPGTSDIELLRRALQAQQARLASAWPARDPGMGLQQPYEALVLASIIEKETGAAADRTLVSAVFLNRLRLGMPLQTDPTVIYGLGDRYDGRLHKADLQSDSAYNTYTRAGLPPTPICSPGLASIAAALHPAQSRALYFVARGDGSSEFSETLADHNRAVDHFVRGHGGAAPASGTADHRS